MAYAIPLTAVARMHLNKKVLAYAGILVIGYARWKRRRDRLIDEAKLCAKAGGEEKAPCYWKTDNPSVTRVRESQDLSPLRKRGVVDQDDIKELVAEFDRHVFTLGRSSSLAYEDILSIIRNSNLNPYAYQTSVEQRELGRKYQTVKDGAGSCLSHFWGEDVERGEEHADKVAKDHVIVLDNVDYYIDDWRKVAIGNPILLRTLEVTEPCGSTYTRCWHFKNDELHMTFNYGQAEMPKRQKKFQHRLWLWQNGDFLDLGDWIYRVRVREMIATDYKVVLLEPIIRKPEGFLHVLFNLLFYRILFQHGTGNLTIFSPSFMVYSAATIAYKQRYTICGVIARAIGYERWPFTGWRNSYFPDKTKKLERIRVNWYGTRLQWSIMRTKERGSLVVKIAMQDSPTYNTIGADEFVEIMSRKKISPTDLKEQFNITSSRARSFYITLAEDLAGAKLEKVPYIHIYEMGDQGGITPEKMKHCTPLMRPLFQIPTTPRLDSAANDKMAVHSRIIEVMNPPVSELDQRVKSALVDFVDHFATETLTKWSFEQVLEKQDTLRKTNSIHASILSEDDDLDDIRRATFLKAETDGGEDKQVRLNPRVISPCEGYMKARYMAYMYPFKEGLTLTVPTVCVGRHVDTIEARMMQLAQASHNHTLYETDLSRMDGRKSIVGRVLFSMLLRKSFPIKEERREVMGLHRSCIGAKCRTRMGVKFVVGFTQGSGYADTTDNNTWDTMFMLYLSKRLEGYSHEEAILWLINCVAVAGDDGLAAQLSVKHFGLACVLCGHKQKCITRIDEPFTFLGRMYAPVHLAKSVRNNCQDPARVYNRFTSTHEPLMSEITRRERLYLKACAILTTDPHSPYISAVARCVLGAATRQYGWEFKRVDVSVKWMMNYVVDGGTYTNHYAEWMEFAHRESQPDADWDAFDEFFSADHTFEEIEEHPPFVELIEHDKLGATFMSVELDHANKQIEVVERGNKSAVPSVKRDDVDGDEYKEAFDRALKSMEGVQGSAAGKEAPPQSSKAESSGVRKPKPKGKDKIRKKLVAQDGKFSREDRSVPRSKL